MYSATDLRECKLFLILVYDWNRKKNNHICQMSSHIPSDYLRLFSSALEKYHLVAATGAVNWLNL